MHRLVPLLLFVTLGACSGGDSSADAARMCSNCLFTQCCLNGACVEGNLPQQCGSHGNPCGVCPGGPCINGACAQQNCNAITCSTGCCSTGGCVSPPNERACGVNGDPCQACAPDQICDRGRCMGTIAASYEVSLASALISSDNCEEPIFGEECDLIVTVTIGSRADIYSSDGAPRSAWEDNNHPVWNYYLFTASSWELSNHLLKISISDEDPGPDDEVGNCQMSASDEDLISGAISGPCGNVELLSFKLHPAE